MPGLISGRFSDRDVFYFDTGLVAYLTKYSSPDILENGALNGAIWENYVVSELLKTYQNDGKECLLWCYRDKEMNKMIIPGLFEPPVRTLRATIPENESHIFR